jgi:membrane protease YdiL (CAAX protease family)
MKAKRGVKRPASVKPNWWLLMSYYLYLFIVWGVFRYTIKIDDYLEEMVIKPLVWLLPLLFVFLTDKSRLRLFDGAVKPAIVLGFGTGLVYFVANILASIGMGKFHGFVITPQIWDFVGISFVTSIVEEIVFSGFVLASFFAWTKHEYLSIFASGVLFALIHIPIGLFIYRYSLPNMVMFLFLVLVVNITSNYLFLKTKNIAAPILSHWMWGIAAAIFR